MKMYKLTAADGDLGIVEAVDDASAYYYVHFKEGVIVGLEVQRVFVLAAGGVYPKYFRIP